MLSLILTEFFIVLSKINIYSHSCDPICSILVLSKRYPFSMRRRWNVNNGSANQIQMWSTIRLVIGWRVRFVRLRRMAENTRNTTYVLSCSPHIPTFMREKARFFELGPSSAIRGLVPTFNIFSRRATSFRLKVHLQPEISRSFFRSTCFAWRGFWLRKSVHSKGLN